MVFSRRHSRRVVREEARPALFCSSSSSSSNVLYLAIQYHYVYMLSLPTYYDTISQPPARMHLSAPPLHLKLFFANSHDKETELSGSFLLLSDSFG